MGTATLRALRPTTVGEDPDVGKVPVGLREDVRRQLHVLTDEEQDTLRTLLARVVATADPDV